MSELARLGVFLVANVLQFSVGIGITGLSYLAYRSSGGRPAFRNSTLGFLLITIGGVLAPVYQIWIKGDYSVSGRELLELQIMEGTLITIGLALLLYSIYSFNAGFKRVSADVYDFGDGKSP
ncbi:hypothetical protein HUG10_06445 [Halorarum halophilum]|uniref:Uncharacterized protein n=1 Tax=Halorarum halophilum TaxID=2743090 RepID=A0A7D5KLW8_9EURY|nr:hypothetical protein [Halobaculum halophilum]QLG27202.1 hypothetical protein HUG10_06445 [Halobaculum halophilum]